MVKDLHSESYKTLRKEMKDHKQKEECIVLMDWKNIVKMTILPQAIYRFTATPIKVPIAFFTELEQIILRFLQKHKRHQLAKRILRRKMKEHESILLCDFKLDCKANLIKTTKLLIRALFYWHKHTHIDQWNRIKCWEMNPYLHGQIFHDKEGKGIKWGKEIAFSVHNVRKTALLSRFSRVRLCATP